MRIFSDAMTIEVNLFGLHRRYGPLQRESICTDADFGRNEEL